MELKELRIELLDLIEENRHKQAFEILKKEISDESERRAKLSLLRRRYNDYNDKKLAQTISAKKIKTEIGRISVSLIDFIESLSPADIEGEIIYANREITNPILIFTAEDKTDEIKDFFLQLNFINAEATAYENENYKLDDFDLVIFDNQELPFCNSEKMLKGLDLEIQNLIQDRIDKMEKVISSSTKFMIHFGEFLYWVNGHRNRVQGANSRFSLHARTKEVIEFINTYRV